MPTSSSSPTSVPRCSPPTPASPSLAARPASATLLDDLRGDQHMGWVPDAMWLSYVKVGAAGRSIAPRPRGLDPRRHAAVGPPRRLRRARRLRTRRVVDGAAHPGRAAGARRGWRQRSRGADRHECSTAGAPTGHARRDHRRAPPRRGRGGGGERGAVVGDPRRRARSRPGHGDDHHRPEPVQHATRSGCARTPRCASSS